METNYIDKMHKKRLINLMGIDNTYPNDTERISLFYIISGNTDLYSKRNAIYDFQRHSIKRCVENSEVDFSSSMYSLIRLGFNLYNGYRDRYTTPLDLFYNLDEQNRKLAENAISLRFNSRLLIE